MIHGDSPSEFGNLLFLAIAAGIGLWMTVAIILGVAENPRVVGFFVGCVSYLSPTVLMVEAPVIPI